VELNELTTMAEGRSLSGLNIQLGQSLANLVGDTVSVVSAEAHLLLAIECQVVIELSALPVHGHKDFIFSWQQIYLKVKVSGIMGEG
jgi:hypothetical protein